MGALKFFRRLPLGEKILRSYFDVPDNAFRKMVFGLEFRNPIGLAAGFDKDARYIDELACLGFGFVEIGTVTPLPQPGNEQPRLFRLPQDEALVNRMGFNNEGAAAAAARLKNRPPGLIIGGNIGKNKITPNEVAAGDYEQCFEALFDVVDYFVVNVSSPNTPGLRTLQEKEPLQALLNHLQTLNHKKPSPKPVLLKIAPDLSNEQLADIVGIVQETGLAGIVATNTTVSRDGLMTPASEIKNAGGGGLSGKPLRQRSTEVIRHICKLSGDRIPVIAVGGIFTAADAREKLEAGASLVQVYTGFIYEGPGIVKKICKGLFPI